MGPFQFALCIWLLMLACFLSGCGQSALDALRGAPASLFKFRSQYWVINAFLSFRGIWAILQIAFFSKWFSVAKFAFPEGLSWANGYLWVCVVAALITLNQLARLRFPSKGEPEQKTTSELTEYEKLREEKRKKNLVLFVRIGFWGGFAMFVLSVFMYFS